MTAMPVYILAGGLGTRLEAPLAAGMMSVLRSDGRWEASDAMYSDGRVIACDKRAPQPRMRLDRLRAGRAAAGGARPRPGGHAEPPRSLPPAGRRRAPVPLRGETVASTRPTRRRRSPNRTRSWARASGHAAARRLIARAAWRGLPLR